MCQHHHVLLASCPVRLVFCYASKPPASCQEGSRLHRSRVRKKRAGCAWVCLLFAFRRWARCIPRRCRLSRKEVIQPHLPVQLPCYDFVPVTRPAFGVRVLAVHLTTSGVTSSHDVTGGVYKARERIHRGVADPRLLATPASCRRVAACNPNYERLSGFAPPRGVAAHCTVHCSVCVALDIKAMLT